MRVLLVLALCLLGSVTARADGYFETGNDLLSNCTNQDSNLEYGLCLGYVSGISDFLIMQGDMRGSGPSVY